MVDVEKTFSIDLVAFRFRFALIPPAPGEEKVYTNYSTISLSILMSQTIYI